MRLTTIILTVAIGALGACDLTQSPLGPSVEINTPESDPCDFDVTIDACAVDTTPVPPVETVPPAQGCDVTLGGTYNAATNACEYVG